MLDDKSRVQYAHGSLAETRSQFAGKIPTSCMPEFVSVVYRTADFRICFWQTLV